MNVVRIRFNKAVLGCQKFWQRKYSYPNLNEIGQLQPREIWPKKNSAEFLASYPLLADDLLNRDKCNFIEIPEIADHFEKMLAYNLKGGKKTLSQVCLATFQALSLPRKLDGEQLHIAHTAAWTIQMFYAKFVIIDDLQDEAEVRRGQKCWYKKEDIGLTVINDADLLDQGVYALLKWLFSRRPNYLRLIELFQDVTRIVSVGQMLDQKVHKNNKPRYELFTAQRYVDIVMCKTSLHCFTWPIKTAMLIVSDDPNVDFDPETFKILVALGNVIQIENDVFDVYADQKNTLKTSNDITEGKFSWLALRALERGSEAQKKIFFQNYAKSDREAQTNIVELYKEMDMLGDYFDYKQTTLKEIKALLKKAPNLCLPLSFLNRLIEHVLIRSRF